jgi:hypothetical protein
VKAKVAFSTGGRSWTEEADLVSLAGEAFKRHGYSVEKEGTWLLQTVSGFMILPQLVGIHPLDKGGVQTLTTMRTNHPTLAPAGVFEYQHSTGNSIADSISKGFDQWLQTDFVPLLDALRPKPESCTTLEMAFPAREGKPARARRAVLGPVAHFMQDPPGEAGQSASEKHQFCPCCLLTNSFEAFREYIE